MQNPMICRRILKMDSLYGRSALLGFVKYNKPQMNADERRLIDASGKSVRTDFGVCDMKGRGYCAI